MLDPDPNVLHQLDGFVGRMIFPADYFTVPGPDVIYRLIVFTGTLRDNKIL